MPQPFQETWLFELLLAALLAVSLHVTKPSAEPEPAAAG